MNDLLGIAIRISVMFLYTLIVLRLSGKRSIGNLSPMDFVVATIIGDLFDDVFWAEIPVAQGLVGLTTILLLHSLISYAGWRSLTIERLVASSKTPVIQAGHFIAQGLKHERTAQENVLAQLRFQDQDKLKEIKEANWEPSGELSLLKQPDAKPAEKRDQAALKRRLK
jgi:uncharacterized membrane protein YcaP (DUF421 family)